MSGFLASARHEVLSIRRSRTAHLLLGVFLAMVLLSSLIGWITNRTVTSVYEQIRADGLTTEPNPFTDVSPLTYARNAIIYVILIGALMAIVLGTQATLRDRQAGTGPLVLTRPVNGRARLVGQLAGAGAVLAAVLLAGIAASWATMSIIQGGVLGPEHTLRLLAFGVLSWVLLESFVVLGMLAGLVSRNETTALLVPFVLWSAVVFVLPQLGTAARPVSLLNPVPHAPSTGGWFDIVSAVTAPLAITEQFKRAGGVLLQDRTADEAGLLGAVPLVVLLAALVVVLATTPRHRMRRPLDE